VLINESQLENFGNDRPSIGLQQNTRTLLVNPNNKLGCRAYTIMD